MDILAILLLLLGGCVAGFLAGFFGVAGGILLVPVLLIAYGPADVTSLVATHLAIGTSLFVVACSAGWQTYQYDREEQVLWREAFMLGIGGVIGALAGGLLAGALSSETLKRIFAAVVFVAAIQLFAERRKPRSQEQPSYAAVRLVATGVVVGLISSLSGVAGALVTVPLLYSMFRLPLKKAFAAASAAIVMIALAGTIGYILAGWHESLLPPGTLGYFDPLRAVPLITGFVPSAYYGGIAGDRTKAPFLVKVFAVLLIVVAAKMIIAP